MTDSPQIMVSGGFDDLRSRHLRFLEESSKLGPVTVYLWPDVMIERVTGRPPKFPEQERLYLVSAVRSVSHVELPREGWAADALPPWPGGGGHQNLRQGATWVVGEAEASAAKASFCRAHGLLYRVIRDDQLRGFPVPASAPDAPGRKKVIVTGCYDWFHSGHVRFFEEVSAYGDLYVVVGHDANIRLLKGEGHPLLGQDERRYVCGSIRYVKEALISSGDGWLDADPEIRRLKPDIYAVNAEGDRGGKREYCQKLGIEYLVLQRTPAAGLPKRSSTELRGF